VLPWGDFNPQEGDSVEAWIGDQSCGQGLLQSHPDPPVGWLYSYKLQVLNDSAIEGCGKLGRLIRFYVNGTPMTLNSAAWDNRQAWFHSLGPPNNPIYLPLVVTGEADTD
jgi:hypothetical protein